MKKIFSVLTLTLALNFLAVAGGVAWLYSEHRLDKEKVSAIKDILFPKDAPASAPTSQPTTHPVLSQPMLKLDELLARTTGRPASEQVEFIQRTFDAQMAIMDRRARELEARQATIDRAAEKLKADREALNKAIKGLEDRQQLATKLQSDQGFQDSLTLYQSMPAKQVKGIFMTLPDDVLLQYMQAMPPRTASKIIKEFKTADETDRIQKVMERMRQAQVSSSQASAGAPPVKE